MTQISSSELLHRISRLENDVEDIKEELKSLDVLKEADVENRTRYEYIIKILDELKTDVKSLKGKSGKFFDSAIIAGIAGLVGFIISKILGS